MINQRLAYLVKNLIQHTLTPSEEEELITLMTEDPDPALLEAFDTLYAQYQEQLTFDPTRKQKNWAAIETKIFGGSKKLRIRSWWYAAACLCILLGVAGIYLWPTASLPHREMTWAQPQHLYLKKEKGKIYALTQNNGTKEALTAKQLAALGIIQAENDHIVIQALEKSTAADLLLTISSPSGHVQKITLSDGSKVWINSNSSLAFPRSFTASAREVALTGEAYFEVAKAQGKPFLVRTGTTTTEVLGTHFTVQNYPDQPRMITLLEGRVKVADSHQSTLLNPGEQAYFQAEQLHKRTIDTTDILAWQQGYFKFENNTITELMQQIQTWYAVEFVHIQTQSDDRFSGTYKRTERLDELLHNLEQVSNLRFIIKAGGIYVVDQ